MPRDLRSYPTKAPCDWEAAQDDFSREEARRLHIRTVVQEMQEDKSNTQGAAKQAAKQGQRPYHLYGTHEACVPRTARTQGDSPFSQRRGKGGTFRDQGNYDLGWQGDSKDRRRDEIKTELEYLQGVSHTGMSHVKTGKRSEFGRQSSFHLSLSRIFQGV